MRLNLLFENLSKNDPQHQEFYRFLKRFQSLITQIRSHIYDKVKPKSNLTILDLSPDGDSNRDSDDKVVVDLSAEPKPFGVAEANHWKFYLIHEMNLIPKLERALKIVNFLIKYEENNPYQDRRDMDLPMVKNGRTGIIKALSWLKSPTDKNITRESFLNFLENLRVAGVWVSDYIPADYPRSSLNSGWATDKDGNQIPTIGLDT